MASFSSPHACAAGFLVLSILVGVPVAEAGQDPLLGEPTDPPALRIPPDQLKGNGPRKDEPARDGEGQPKEGGEPDDALQRGGGAGEKIREMLEGRGDPRETGDPILDGVLDLLRNRGSVLDGSPLDPRSEESGLRPLPDAAPMPGAGPAPEWVPYREGQSHPRSIPRPAPTEKASAPGAADDASRYLLAEQLLRTARLLAAQPPGDAQRQQLIDDLRNEAARCLAPQPPAPPNYGPVPAGHSEPY